jgi:hypothetical protein
MGEITIRQPHLCTETSVCGQRKLHPLIAQFQLFAAASGDGFLGNMQRRQAYDRVNLVTLYKALGGGWAPEARNLTAKSQSEGGTKQ